MQNKSTVVAVKPLIDKLKCVVLVMCLRKDTYKNLVAVKTRLMIGKLNTVVLG